MVLKSSLTIAATALAIIGGISALPTPTQAQSNVEAEIIGFRQLCDKGDRRACVHFGILIGENQQRRADWRKAHADWFWWEK